MKTFRFFTFCKIIFIFCVISLTIGNNTAYSQTWQWAKCPTYCGVGVTYSIVDHENNILVYGGMGGDSVKFDTITLSNFGPFAQCFFIAKYDSNGNVIWAKNVTGNNTTGNDIYPVSIAVDIYNNIYAIGSFVDTFFVGGSKLFIPPLGIDGDYIIKFNSEGDIIWAHAISGYASFVISDNIGNIYITGLTNNYLFYDTIVLARPGYLNNMYIAKFDSGGHPLWARTAGDNTANVWGRELAVDKNNNIIVGGFYDGDFADFGATSISGGFMFLAKYNDIGNLQWVQSSGYYLHNYAEFINSIACDTMNNINIIGTFSDSVRFGNELLIANNQANMFLTKYDSSGNVVWARAPIGNGSGSGIATDPFNRIYATCNYDSIINFGNGVTASGNFCVVKYDENGNALWAKHAGNNSGNNHLGIGPISIDQSGNIYVSGGFSDSLNIPSIPDLVDSFLPTCNDTDNMFLAKLSNPENAPIINKAANKIEVYPNPSSGAMQVAFMANGYTGLRVYDAIGRQVYEQPLTGTERQVALQLSNLPAGVYYLQATGKAGNAHVPFVIER